MQVYKCTDRQVETLRAVLAAECYPRKPKLSLEGVELAIRALGVNQLHIAAHNAAASLLGLLYCDHWGEEFHPRPVSTVQQVDPRFKSLRPDAPLRAITRTIERAIREAFKELKASNPKPFLPQWRSGSWSVLDETDARIIRKVWAAYEDDRSHYSTFKRPDKLPPQSALIDLALAPALRRKPSVERDHFLLGLYSLVFEAAFDGAVSVTFALQGNTPVIRRADSSTHPPFTFELRDAKRLFRGYRRIAQTIREAAAHFGFRI